MTFVLTFKSLPRAAHLRRISQFTGGGVLGVAALLIRERETRLIMVVLRNFCFAEYFLL